MPTRPVMVCLLVLSLFAIADSAQALCVKCISNECWSQSTATAAECFSYGTSCLTSGKCVSGGGGLGCDWTGDGDLCEQGALSTPLASEYVLASVKVQRHAVQSNVAVAGSQPRQHTR